MKIPQLTFTRFLAAFSIVVLHYGLFVEPFNSEYTFHYFCLADSAVSYFFLLSGFIMIIAQYKKGELPATIGKKDFWTNRFARIYPLYLFALLVFIAVNIRVHSWQELKNITPHFLYAFSLTQAWNYQLVMDVNFPSWSLSVEAFFYLLFPFLYPILLNRSTRWLIVFSVGCWVVNSTVFYLCLENDAIHHLYYYNPLFHLATFTIGISAGLLFVRHFLFLEANRRYVFSAFLLLVLGFIIAVETDARFLFYRHNGILAPLFIALIFSLAFLKGLPAKILGGKFPVYLGDISYGLYILQAPVMYFFLKNKEGLKSLDDIEFFYLYFIALLAVTVASHHFIERPAKKWLKESFLKKHSDPR